MNEEKIIELTPFLHLEVYSNFSKKAKRTSFKSKDIKIFVLEMCIVVVRAQQHLLLTT